MEDSKEKIGLLLDSGYQSDSTPVSESPVPDEKTSAGSKYEASEAKDEKDRFYTVNVGAWTVYYAIASAWTNPLPGLKFIQRGRDIILGLPVVWKFLLENLSLGPVLFLTYFLSTMLSGLISSAKLYNSMKILELIEKPEANQDINRQNFYRIVFGYLLAFLADWVVRKIGARGEPILRQRVNLYFRTKILAAHSRLDYATFHDPVIQTKLRRAEGYSSSAWAILESVSTMISMAAEVATQTSVMIQVLSAREDSLTFFIVCLAKSLVSQFAYSFTGAAYYTQITDPRWMRMDALYDMGTQDHFKQDVLGDNLEEYINTEYKKNREEFGDTRSDQPEIQWESKSLLSLTDLDAVLDVIPTIAFAWSAVQGTNASRLSSLILIQQATTSLHATASRIWYSGGDLASVITNIISLCDVIETKPKVPDGEIAYPEHADQTGMSIEFKCVGFSYPGQDRHILKDMSFCIGAGQLCVIVGENGCGKSTTISLISRLYDCTSGEILIDGRPLTDFKISTVRDATCVMYQNYSHYPLPVGENIRIGRYSEGSQEDVETAAKLAGAYDFIQKLPEKFDTDLAYNSSGYGSHWYQDDEQNPFQNLIDAQHKTQVSGGEWRRLALAKTYMRNSDRIKLLCYDEPSASLDPKAESKAFEQIRSLQGQKTMIFITHRFGHLTKHADIILYMQDGAIIEKGTHQELMALDGEYAKMYNIQSRAFI